MDSTGQIIALIKALASSGGGGGYILPILTELKLGGAKAKKKTDAQTTPVGADSKGFLWVAPPQWND